MQDRRGFLVAQLKEGMIGEDKFRSEMAKVNQLEQEQLKDLKRMRGSGVLIGNNYEIKALGTHGALSSFGVA